MFSYLHIQQLQSNIIIDLELCFQPSDEWKCDIRSLPALFWALQSPDENICNWQYVV